MDYYYYDYENDKNVHSVMQDEDEGDYDEYSISDDGESLKDIYNICMLPSTTQVINYIVTLMSCCLLYNSLRCLLEKYWPSKDTWHHSCSIFFGCALLYMTLGPELLLIFFISLLTYIVIMMVRIRPRQFKLGVIITVFTIMLQVSLEFLIMQYIEWHKLRGVQMIASMKMISFAYDYQTDYIKDSTDVFKLSSLLSYLGYIFCPTTCLLGPWMPYTNYIQKQKLFYSSTNRLYRLVTNIFYSIVFLNSCNCLIPWFRSKYMASWTHYYFDALNVRCSHYFIGYLSQAAIAFEGDLNTKADYTVIQPIAIELPRSLHSLVRYWNMPMHIWLKTYIFKPLQAAYKSYFISIASTYMVSALLHGFHTNVHLVLLSLAAFTYVENILRSTLAQIYDACLEVNGCRKMCPYTHCPKGKKCSFNIFLVHLMNLLFTILTIIHLTYLGIIMSNDEPGDLYNKSKGIVKWHRLNYFSHWINLAMYLFYLYI